MSDRRRARILVVDDDPAVGLAMQRSLRRGYDVVVETSSPMALARLNGGERFDLIVSVSALHARDDGVCLLGDREPQPYLPGE